MQTQSQSAPISADMARLSEAQKLLAQPRPNLSNADLARILADGWGLCGQLTQLSGERDCNALLEMGDGANYVLKVYNASEKPEVCAFQNEILIRLEGLPEIATPKLIRAKTGAPQILTHHTGQTYVVTLLGYVPGVDPVAPVVQGYRKALGRASAVIGRALAGFEAPEAHREILWNHMHVGNLGGLLTLIEDPARRAWLARRLDEFAHDVAPKAKKLPQQIIHNDLNPSNIRVDPANPERVIGIIDFGDATYAPRINDLAVALSYALPPDGDIVGAAEQMVEGYETIQPLLADEVDLLPQMICARLTTRILLTHWRYKMFSHQGGYILRNLSNAWQAMDAFMAVQPAEVAQRLLKRRLQQGGPNS